MRAVKHNLQKKYKNIVVERYVLDFYDDQEEL